MTTKGTLTIYLCAEDEDWILVPSGDDALLDSYTRVIRESYSWAPTSTTKVGKRLTNHAKVGEQQCQVIPSEWVVVDVEVLEGSKNLKEFSKVVLAYCERQPLSVSEVEEKSYVIDVKQPALA